MFLIFWYPGNIGKLIFSNFLISWKCGRRAGGSRGQAPGGLDYFWNMFLAISGHPGILGNMIVMCFHVFFQNDSKCNQITQNQAKMLFPEIGHVTKFQNSRSMVRKKKKKKKTKVPRSLTPGAARPLPAFPGYGKIEKADFQYLQDRRK